ncbi:hypothetical protein LTR37_001829 [Vermiconidia calcicola]|uniref:Uncharacterized protein n=1 Tax=Vermiconidia calcicola TaxID=1690605 RepID=A0ACC3NUY4_9PEZI|nr:hypothetical protein LTR37_001829 [Vermiconidia calcicola]
MAIPAEPLLASAIWSSEQALKTSPSSKPTSRNDGLNTGCHAVDNALGYLAEYGSINCISGEPNTGARDICQALLVSHLLGSPKATAVVIDTGLAFDVRAVHRVLTQRMHGETDAAQQAVRILDRLKIMKVFDFEGLTECVSEIRSMLETKAAPQRDERTNAQVPKTTVRDSEDEEEMLDTTSPSETSIQPTTKQSTQEESTQASGFVLIDNLSQVTTPMIKNHHAHGQAVLASFMRSLSHLTTTHNLCTTIINGTTSSTNFKDEAPSIFSSCTLRPILGKAFAHQLDNHLLVHEMASMTGKKKEANGTSRMSPDGRKIAASVAVIEVLQDRNGGRLGRWAPFRIDGNGGLTGSV